MLVIIGLLVIVVPSVLFGLFGFFSVIYSMIENGEWFHLIVFLWAVFSIAFLLFTPYLGAK